MSKHENVAYEPHPVTPERKAELRAQGLCIIDIQFKPAPTAEELAERERAEAEAMAAEIARLAQIEAETQAEADRLESERIAAEEAKAAAEKAEADRLAKVEADRVEAERLAAEAAQAEVDRVAAEAKATAPAAKSKK